MGMQAELHTGETLQQLVEHPRHVVIELHVARPHVHHRYRAGCSRERIRQKRIDVLKKNWNSYKEEMEKITGSNDEL